VLILGVDDAVEEVFLLAVREFLVALDRLHEIRLLVTAVGVNASRLNSLLNHLSRSAIFSLARFGNRLKMVHDVTGFCVLPLRKANQSRASRVPT